VGVLANGSTNDAPYTDSDLAALLVEAGKDSFSGVRECFAVLDDAPEGVVV